MILKLRAVFDENHWTKNKNKEFEMHMPFVIPLGNHSLIPCLRITAKNIIGNQASLWRRTQAIWGDRTITGSWYYELSWNMMLGSAAEPSMLGKCCTWYMHASRGISVTFCGMVMCRGMGKKGKRTDRRDWKKIDGEKQIQLHTKRQLYWSTKNELTSPLFVLTVSLE